MRHPWIVRRSIVCVVFAAPTVGAQVAPDSVGPAPRYAAAARTLDGDVREHAGLVLDEGRQHVAHSGGPFIGEGVAAILRTHPPGRPFAHPYFLWHSADVIFGRLHEPAGELLASGSR